MPALPTTAAAVYPLVVGHVPVRLQGNGVAHLIVRPPDFERALGALMAAGYALIESAEGRFHATLRHSATRRGLTKSLFAALTTLSAARSNVVRKGKIKGL